MKYWIKITYVIQLLDTTAFQMILLDEIRYELKNVIVSMILYDKKW